MNTLRILVGVAGLALTSVAYSQTATESQKAPLKGPAVHDRSVPGNKTNFGSGSGKNGKDRLDQIGTPMPVFMKAIETLREPAAGDNRLTDEQDAGIKKVREEFDASTKSYMEQHQDEVKSLMTRISPEDKAKFGQALGREGGRLGLAKRGFKGSTKNSEKAGKPAADAKPDDMQGQAPAASTPKTSPEESAKARERLKAIFDGRPQPKDAQTKMFGALTDTQKKLVQEALQKQRDELAKKAAAKKGSKGARGEKEAGPATTTGSERKAGGADRLKNATAEDIINNPNVPERLRERLKAMSPEDRERAIERVRERLKNGNAK